MLKKGGKIQRFLSFMVVSVILASFLSPVTISAATFSEIYSAYKNINGRTLVVSHKGDWRHYPENSLSGIQSAIDMGADIIEMDIRKTKDGVLILQHDDNVNRMTNGTGTVSNLTLEQIKALYLRQGEGGSGAALTTERVPTFQEVLDICKNKVMINIDKAWEIRDDVYSLLQANGMVDHGIFKATDGNSVVQPWLDSKSPRPNFIAVINNTNVGNIDALLAGAKPDGFEVVFTSDTDAPILDVNMNKIRPAARIWINSLWDSLCGGHTDAVSLTNPSNGWDWLMGKGADMIQTDRSRELINHLNPGPQGTIAGGWTNTDIGLPAARGYAAYDGNTGRFKVAGSGDDIWGTSDKFQYVYKQMTGDCSIVVRVSSLLNTHVNAKAGVMIRETLAANSKFMDCVIYPADGIRFQQRSAAGGSAVTLAMAAGKPSEYLKLVRSGNHFSAYYSDNGITWSQIGSTTSLSMSDNVYVGMVVTSHSNGVIADALFQNVSLQSSTTQQVAVLQQGLNNYYGTVDTHILESKQDRNTGGHTLIEATTYNGGGGDEKNILVKYDLSSIPSNATITSATMDLCLINVRNGIADKTVDLHEITESWTEGSGTGIDGQVVSGVTWLTQPAYSSTTMVSQTIGSMPDTWYTFNVTGLVQQWVNGTKTNYGITIKENVPNSSAGAKDFASSEYETDISKRPRLSITYTTP